MLVIQFSIIVCYLPSYPSTASGPHRCRTRLYFYSSLEQFELMNSMMSLRFRARKCSISQIYDNFKTVWKIHVYNFTGSSSENGLSSDAFEMLILNDKHVNAHTIIKTIQCLVFDFPSHFL